MIDTVKVFTFINYNTYNIIKNNSNIKCMYNFSDKKIFYEIINSSLSGSYDSSLSVRVSDASKYFVKGYVLEVEGSLSKIINGQNSYNGFYNLTEIVHNFKKLIENSFLVTLPNIKHWFLQRIDIAKCFDLETQDNVKKYINSLNLLSYPRRTLNFYMDKGVYFSGQVTTLKIYNKLLEFRTHDKNKLLKLNFNILDFEKKIDGFIRFECEIKKKKLKKFFNKDYIRVDSIIYKDLESLWCDEFMKVLKFNDYEIKKIVEKDLVLNRLKFLYSDKLSMVLYNFYLSLKVDGYNFVKNNTKKSTFYRCIKQLKDASIDFSSNAFYLTENKDYYMFNPFTFKEVV